MAEDRHVKEYMDCIRRSPKFVPTGQLDEDGFYNQPDGSFFDPDGYYFNPQGYDELGGYYDENGEYCEADFEGLGDEPHEGGHDEDLLIQEAINASAPGTIFTAVLTNLPYRAGYHQVESELKNKGAAYIKLDLERDQANKLQSITVVMNSKPAALAVLHLNGQDFLGRRLNVEFPDIADIETGLGGDVPIPVATTVEPPAKSNGKKEEEKPAPARKQEETPKTAEEVKKEPVVEKKNIEVPQGNVWGMSAEDMQELIKPAAIIKYEAKPAAKAAAPAKPALSAHAKPFVKKENKKVGK